LGIAVLIKDVLSGDGKVRRGVLDVGDRDMWVCSKESMIITGEKGTQQNSYGGVAIHGMCFGVGIEKIGYGRFRGNLIGNDAIGDGPKIGSELNGAEVGARDSTSRHAPPYLLCLET